MFEDYKGIINIEKIIKNKYNKNINDISDLMEQPFIEYEGDGVDALFWIKYDDNEYLFKRINEADYNIWGELLSEQIAKFFGLNCAEYRYATFKDKEGLLTKNFLKNDEKLILASEIFQEFFSSYEYKTEKHVVNNKKFRELYNIPNDFIKLSPYDRKRKMFNLLNNVEDFWSILKNLDYSQEEIELIIKDLFKKLIFDLITLQGDRHPNNWGIKYNNKIHTSAPLFDNSTSFGLGYPNMIDRINNFRSEVFNSKFTRNLNGVNNIIYETKPTFTISNLDNLNPNDKEKNTIPNVLKNIIKISDSSVIEIIENMLDSLTEENIEKMITIIEKTNGIKMNDDIYFYITNVLKNNINCLKNIIIDYKKGSKYERRK